MDRRCCDCDCDCHKPKRMGTRVDQILSPEDLTELVRDMTVPPLPRYARLRRRRGTRRFGPAAGSPETGSDHA